MWILKWLPDWIFYGVLLLGVLGYTSTHLIKLLSFIPGIYMYKKPIELVSIGLIVIGTFMSGAIHDNNAWLERVDEMKAKVAKAEEEAKAALPAKGYIIEHRPGERTRCEKFCQVSAFCKQHQTYLQEKQSD